MRTPFEYEECVDPDCDCHNMIQLELPAEYLPREKENECESE